MPCDQAVHEALAVRSRSAVVGQHSVVVGRNWASRRLVGEEAPAANAAAQLAVLAAGTGIAVAEAVARVQVVVHGGFAVRGRPVMPGELGLGVVDVQGQTGSGMRDPGSPQGIEVG